MVCNPGLSGGSLAGFKTDIKEMSDIIKLKKYYLWHILGKLKGKSNRGRK